MYKSCLFMRFSTIFRVQSLKSLSEFLRSLLLISLMSDHSKFDFVSSLRALRSLCQGAPSLPKWRFTQERRVISKSDVPSSAIYYQKSGILADVVFVPGSMLVCFFSLLPSQVRWRLFSSIDNINTAWVWHIYMFFKRKTERKKLYLPAFYIPYFS